MAVRLPINVMVLMVATDFLRENLRSSSQKLMSGWMIEIALVMPAKNSIANQMVCNRPPSGSVPNTYGMVWKPRPKVPSFAHCSMFAPAISTAIGMTTVPPMMISAKPFVALAVSEESVRSSLGLR